ncbi:hypothetical protein KNP414_02846 [Paenibacillus mucilaginosus KNP414]|uniref:Uncharacterized protein n=1 Tax=Paenibacillus mucilaginosus (strain KNP414) TaxID=1036673 RepID=F8FCY8_PAEMK|nr:hypothetical protein KNP414_02846 [Paenibacillus mucilaginosus KNP414]
MIFITTVPRPIGGKFANRCENRYSKNRYRACRYARVRSS